MIADSVWIVLALIYLCPNFALSFKTKCALKYSTHVLLCMPCEGVSLHRNNSRLQTDKDSMDNACCSYLGCGRFHYQHY